jgi:outer membrane protein assembly factor BamB
VVFALEAETGQLQWKRDPVAPNTAPNWSPLSVANGRLYFGSGDGHVYALDTETGEDVWSFPPPRSAARQTFASCPTLSDKVAYVSAKDGTLYALDAQTGDLLWRRTPQHPAGDGLLSGVMWPPAVSHKKVFIASLSGTVSAYQSTGGALPGEITEEVRELEGEGGKGREEEGGVKDEGTEGAEEGEEEGEEGVNIFEELDKRE